MAKKPAVAIKPVLKKRELVKTAHKTQAPANLAIFLTQTNMKWKDGVQYGSSAYFDYAQTDEHGIKMKIRGQRAGIADSTVAAAIQHLPTCKIHLFTRKAVSKPFLYRGLVTEGEVVKMDHPHVGKRAEIADLSVFSITVGAPVDHVMGSSNDGRSANGKRFKAPALQHVVQNAELTAQLIQARGTQSFIYW